MKIISDGMPQGTKVLDKQGREVEGIKSIQWELESNQVAILKLEFIEINDVILESKHIQRPLTIVYHINGEDYVKKETFEAVWNKLAAAGLV